MDQFRIRLLCPAPRGCIEFVREDAHGNRDGDAFGIEIPFAKILPIETGARERGVRQASDRDVRKDGMSREDFGYSRKDARDQLIAPCGVTKEISPQASGGIPDSV